MGYITNKDSDILKSSDADSSLKGTLAFHPLFTKITEELLDALCEDCKTKVKSKFDEYLRDATLRKDTFEESDPKMSVPARNHPDLTAFLEIRDKVVWEENRHLKCYARSWSRLRFLRG